MRFLILALFLLTAGSAALVDAQATSPGDAYGLHPVCDRVHRVSVSRAQTVIAAQNTTELEVSCFSFSAQAVDASSACAGVTGLMVLDIFDPSVNEGQSVDLGSLYRGSMYATAFRFVSVRQFRIQFIYPQFQTCPVTLYFSMYATVSVRRREVTSHPFVLSAQPIVMYRNAPYTIAFRSPLALTAAEQANVRLTLVPASQSCPSAAPAAFRANPATAVFSNATDFTWTSTSTHNGGFGVCVQSTANGSWDVVAFVEAYGANPAYFDTALLESERNSVTYRIDFYGHGLSAAADRLRMVAASAGSCGSDPVAATTVRSSALQQGRAANSTTATVTFYRNNLYLVCYLHSASGEWVDVPNYDSMSRHVIDNVTDPEQQRVNGGQAQNASDSTGGSAAPSAPSASGGECLSAPYNASAALVVSNKLVRLTTSDATLPGDFAQQIATVLCLPSASLVRVYKFEDSAVRVGSKDVYLSIDCGEGVCNNAERQAALVLIAVQRLDGVQAAEQVSFTGVAVHAAAPQQSSHDESDAPTTLYIVIGLMAGLVLVLVVALAVVARRRSAEARRHAADDSDVVQGHVVHVEPALGAVPARHDPYSGGHYEPGNQEDLAPIPPPPEKLRQNPIDQMTGDDRTDL